MRLLFLLLAFSVSALSAQDTQKRTLKNKKDNVEEIFYVQKTNPEVKDGSYMKMYGKKPLMTGFYKEDKEDSLWAYYSHSGRMLSSGSYNKGKKTGVWKYYGNYGELIQKYDYDNHKMLFDNTEKEDIYPYELLNEVKATDTIVQPSYLGGKNAILRFLSQNIQYPATARDNDYQGKVVVRLTINEKGEVSNYKVVEGMNDDLNDEGLRVLKMLPADWVPATINNSPVASEVFVPVVFRLQ